MKCPKCEYEWEPRKEKPKECPSCKYRLRYDTNGDVIKLTKTEE
jgi:rubrerythrin